ncbi:MAG: ATP-binding protein [Mariprofundus sp.]
MDDGNNHESSFEHKVDVISNLVKSMESAENDLHLSLDAMDEMLFQLDAQGLCLYANASCATLLGYDSAADMTGMHVHDLFHQHLFESDCNDKACALCLAMQQGEKVRLCSEIKLAGDKEPLPVEFTCHPIFRDSLHIGFMVTIRDNSKDKELEEQFMHAQKMDAIGIMASGLAHDFNNVLAGINGNLFLLEKDISTSSKSMDKIKRIENLTARAADMIKQLLGFSRKSSHIRKIITIAPFIKEIIQLQQVSVPENISLNQHIPDCELQVQGDESQIQQALMNLINNARDAVSDVKKPSITVSLTPFEADDAFLRKHSSLTARAFACISVSDNGCGIKQAYINRIFEPYFTTKDADKGTGLGLAMVCQSIASHGGALEVESTLAKGTTFNIYLPCLADKVESPADRPEQLVIPGNRETILLVDDNQFAVEAIRDVLDMIGYRVLTAANGLEAIDLLQSEKNIDLFILDVVMPTMGGVECAEFLLRNNPESKIIFSTGYDLDNALKEFMQRSHALLLPKPCSIQELSQTIRTVLDTVSGTA